MAWTDAQARYRQTDGYRAAQERYRAKSGVRERLNGYSREYRRRKQRDPEWAAKQAEYQRERYRSSPELRAVQRNRRYVRKYGITAEEYDARVAAQGHACAICRGAEGRLCVDHDHNTGRVRGLLCDACNFLIGLARDDADLLRQAIEYLRAD